MLNYKNLENQAPKSWKDILDYYKKNFQNFPLLQKFEFSQLPFEMQLGIFLKYFRENGIELDVQNVKFEDLPLIIEDTFKSYEKTMGHFS